MLSLFEKLHAIFFQLTFSLICPRCAIAINIPSIFFALSGFTNAMLFTVKYFWSNKKKDNSFFALGNIKMLFIKNKT